MTSHILEIQQRSVPLFSNKDIKILPGTSTSIQLSGDLPCTFTSGIAIIRVKPVEHGFSFNTIEVEFLDQTTCIHSYTLVLIHTSSMGYLQLCSGYSFSMVPNSTC